MERYYASSPYDCEFLVTQKDHFLSLSDRYYERNRQDLMRFFTNAFNETFLLSRPEDYIYKILEQHKIRIPLIFGRGKVLTQAVSILAISYAYIFHSVIHDGVGLAFTRHFGSDFVEDRDLCARAKTIEYIVDITCENVFSNMLGQRGFLEYRGIVEQQYMLENTVPFDKNLILTMAKDWYGITLCDAMNGSSYSGTHGEGDAYFYNAYRLNIGAIAGMVKSKGLINDVKVYL